MQEVRTFDKLRHACALILDKQKVTSRMDQDMMRHARHSSPARMYQHVATEDTIAAARDWDRAGVYQEVIALSRKTVGKRA